MGRKQHEVRVSEFVSDAAARRADDVALVGEPCGTLTYGQLDDRTTRLANGLLGSGLTPGDRVCTWMEDTSDYIELYLAAAKAGLVVVPINAAYKPAEARHILEDSSCRGLVHGAATAERVRELDLGSELPLLAGVGDDLLPGGVAFDDLQRGAATRPGPPPAPDDLFILAYTSGTTGQPKAAMLTHGSVTRLSMMQAHSLRIPLYARCAYSPSMSFAATIPAMVTSHLYVGGQIHMACGWEVDRVVDLMADVGATFTYIASPRVGEYADAFRKNPDALKCATGILHAGSKVPADTLRDLHDAVGRRLVEGWGMTEVSGGVTTATAPQDYSGPCEAMDLFASVGRAVAGSRVDIIDDQGRALPHDGSEVGELVIRSPAVMAGYWNQPERTAECLVDGWYHSGDMGAIDPAGYVYMHERRVDLIVSGGINVYPVEVEDVINRMDEVAECAVGGVPHERWGQGVGAVVVRRPGSELTARQVVDHCRAHLASYKKPVRVLFADALPRTTSEKIRRSDVRRMLEQGGEDVNGGITD